MRCASWARTSCSSRDGQGRLGLIGQACSHRGSSLEYGDVEERGIRCAYHGWLYDVAGNCLEQPSEPPESAFCAKVRHPAYPVRSLGGLLFAYMGPDPDNPPPLPNYSPLVDHGGQRLVESTRALRLQLVQLLREQRRPLPRVGPSQP